MKTSKKIQYFEGEVVTKLDKTAQVNVQIMKFHPKYKKRYACSRKYAVHDEKNVSKVGDTVQFQSCRPFSKTKKWSLVSVLDGVSK